MKIAVTSDLHGYLGFNIEPCDALLLAGDIVDISYQFKAGLSYIWFKEDFFPWCMNQPCDKVFMIAGNHDAWISEVKSEFMKLINDPEVNVNGKVVYLENEVVEYNGINIYGSPYSKTFGRWYFMKGDDDLKPMIKDAIGDKKIDIALIHDMPYNCSDVLLQKDCRWANGDHIGTKAYEWMINEYKPKYYFGGHLHSCNHEENKVGDTSVYCVSMKNEDYRPVYKPLYLEI